MAHRGPLREVFVGIGLLLLAKKAEKVVSPTHTGFIMDAADEIAVAQNVTMQPQTVTPSSTGVLPLFFAFFLSNFSDIVEEVLFMAVMEVLGYGLLPAVLLVTRFCVSTRRRTSHLVRWFGASEHVTDAAASDATGAEDGNDMGCHPIKTHPSQAEIPDNTPSSPTSDQVIDSLRAEAAGKDAQIAALTQAAKEKSKTISDINRRNDNLYGKLRTTLDPNGLYKSTSDLFVVAKDFTKDFDRVSRKLERQREAISNAQDRDTQISTLSANNTRLEADLKRQIREAAEEAEWQKEKAETKHSKLRERLLKAERRAHDGTMPIEDYRRKLQEVHDLQIALTNAGNQTADAKRDHEAALQALRQEVNDLKADIQSLRDTEEQSTSKGEEQARKLQVDNDQKLELANKAAQDAEKKVEATDKMIETAKKQAEAAEKRMETAEKNVSERIAEVNELRSQLANAQEQTAEIRQPTLSRHGREEETTSQEHELRGQIDQLTVENSNLQLARANQQAHTQKEVDKARADERSEAQRALEESQEQLRDQMGRQWADDSRRLQEIIRRGDAEILRLNQIGREVEQRLNNTVNDLDGVRQQLSNTEAINAQKTLEIRQLQEENNDSAKAKEEVKEAQKHATQLYNKGAEQWERAEAAEKRANEAEAEIEKYKRGKQDQDGRIKEKNQQIETLKRRIPANADMDAAEFDAITNSHFRACTIIEESVNRHYDFATRGVLIQLMKANDKIDELKVSLKKPGTRSSRKLFLDILDDAEVDKNQYKALTYSKRQVLVRQCAAVNAKLAALRYIIKASGQPNKDQLLAEIYKPRGDEQAVWDDQDSEPEPESDEDEDDHGNDGDDGNSGRAVHPFEPLPARSRKKPSEQPEGQNTPMPSNPNSDNPLKRKINPDDNESEGLGKRQVDSDMGMRPIAGLFPQPPQQGSSFPEADIDQSETKPESQDDLQSSEWIGEAAAPQIQSIDQTHHSSQPGPPSSNQNFSTVQTTPSIWSAIPSQGVHPFQPRPTKIPAPKAEAHQTPSERQERLAIGGRQDKSAAPAQSSVPSTGEGSTGFSFSAPRHISSGILPHVRTYTRLSGKTNNVLSRHRQTNPGRAKP